MVLKVGAASEKSLGHRSMPSPGEGPCLVLLGQKSARERERQLEEAAEREARSCD